MTVKLTEAGIEAALAGLHGWTYAADRGAVTRTFAFADFSEAFGFMARVALAAEKADHHPDWSNSYNSVTVSLSTHSAGGLTDKDVALAKAMNRLAG